MTGVGWWCVWLIGRNVDASEKNSVATRILVFDFEFFIDVWYSDAAA